MGMIVIAGQDPGPSVECRVIAASRDLFSKKMTRLVKLARKTNPGAYFWMGSVKDNWPTIFLCALETGVEEMREAS